MSLFKKSNALYYEKLNVLREVTVSSEKVKLTVQYSQIDLKPEDVPKLLADVTLLYGLVKPMLDEESEELKKDKNKNENIEDVNDEPIDLSNIPF